MRKWCNLRRYDETGWYIEFCYQDGNDSGCFSAGIVRDERICIEDDLKWWRDYEIN